MTASTKSLPPLRPARRGPDVDAPPARLDAISVRGAAEHNLRDFDVDLPRDSLVVITGLSGSGKSSLAFDTIYQEGQRRFMESLSSYARQFLGSMEKPRVERVDGLSPTLCIDQKTVNRNPRSTVGTVTEIQDHLRLLMARLGTPRCPTCKREIKALSPGQIADAILREHKGAKLHVLAPIVEDRKGEYRKELAQALAQGFIRARVDGKIVQLDEGEIVLDRYVKHTIELVIDRLRARAEDRPRLVEAIERALRLTNKLVSLLAEDADGKELHQLYASDRTCPDHGISIPEMEPRLFSFNAPQGMCGSCQGIGWTEDFDLELLFDPDAPFDRALRPLQQDERLPFTNLTRGVLGQVGAGLGLKPKTKWGSLTDAQRWAFLDGADIKVKVESNRVDEATGATRKSSGIRTWGGIMPTVRQVWYYTQLKRLAEFRRRLHCAACGGQRLNEIARAVDLRGTGIATLSAMTVEELSAFFADFPLEAGELAVGGPIVRELRARLAFLDQVGLGYLSIERSAATLSGGESQRIRLASQVGAALQGVTYVLDEPSIGLHPRDQARLLDALVALRDKGNSVLVVEHDAATMARADWLVEIGPAAGVEGGQLVASSRPDRFVQSGALTARYLRGEIRIPLPARRRPTTGPWLELKGCTGHNLKAIDLRVPLGAFTAVSGVSGSGKSTAVTETLYKALARQLHRAEHPPLPFKELLGIEHIDKVVEIDQDPIGRTPRSNPATYSNAFDPIRDLFAQLPEARARGWKKGRFSFNVAGGRCEECSGAGVKTVEMQFLADVQVPCEACNGKRFNPETLELRYRGRTITDVLEMKISEAARFFANHRKIHRILSTLETVGLGYISLGQPSTTLSGGEAQRVKLATELQRPATGRTLYILDEPTTGLHMADVARLLGALQALVDAGNTVLVIEHDLDVLKVADHVIDLGPDGGGAGGFLTGAGTPEEIARLDTPTGRVFATVLAHEAALDAHEAAPHLAAEPPLSWITAPSRRKRKGTAISLRGVETHNLQHIDLDLPAGKMTVITGPSGSGKTSLAFDTLFAEGQRRYVESLSTYARRFLGRMDSAKLDKAEGLAPAIAIDQAHQGSSPRSTVATATEIQDGLRLLFARIGQPHCPTCGRALQALSPSAAARLLQQLHPGPGWLLGALPAGTHAGDLRADGFVRFWEGPLVPGGERELEGHKAKEILPEGAHLVIDRLDPAKSELQRLSEAVASAYGWGGDRAIFLPRSGAEAIVLTRAADCPEHGQVLPEELTPRHFSFNSHVGACTSCDGLGKRLQVDPALLFPASDQPLEGGIDGRVGAVVFRSARKRAMVEALYARFGVARATPISALPRPLRRELLQGSSAPLSVQYSRDWGSGPTHISETRDWEGIVPLIEGWKGRADWLMRESTCSACEGARLRPPLLAVTIGEQNIAELSAMTVVEARAFWAGLRLGVADTMIAEQVLRELQSRLGFLEDVGLGYLTLDRPSETLSGGESQRIRLATQLGAHLTGTIYVLDEPTIGLHPRDTERLLGTLFGLRDLGNTIIVVEHDPEVMKAADHLVDLGPGAGEHGGRIVAQGSPAEVSKGPGLTAEWLSGRKKLPRPHPARKPKGWLQPPASRLHNLKGIAPPIPLGCLTVLTGVSGSGKSTLAMDHLVPWLREELTQHKEIKAGKGIIKKLEVIDQHPIGRTPRSCPATFLDLLGDLRDLFAATPLAKERGYKASRFLYNTPTGGRCIHCEGRGAVLIEMHFLSDVWVPCEHCGGRRYDAETLEIRWKGLTIADMLDLPAEDALPLLQNQRRLRTRLAAMVEVGLGYVRLGQPATTLSGGEAQRMKLAQNLTGRATPTCFVLDEPTTGLHFGDVERLLGVLHSLVDKGHTAILVEHHLDVLRHADHLIDLGPEGGDQGGEVVATGTPEALAKVEGSWTGRALRLAGGGT